MSLVMRLESLREDQERLAAGRHGDPFAVLGRHPDPNDGWSVRIFRPDAAAAWLLCGRRPPQAMQPLGLGLFVGDIMGPKVAYRLRLHRLDGSSEEGEDPYRFGLALAHEDALALRAGRCWRAHRLLGAHGCALEGVEGVRFAVWAPKAQRVSVVGDWNGWDPRRHPMRYRHEIGTWEIFLPGPSLRQTGRARASAAPAAVQHAFAGAAYAFDVLQADGRSSRRRDPYARALSGPRQNAVVVEPPRPLAPVAPRPPEAAAGVLLAADPHQTPLVGSGARQRLLRKAHELGCSHVRLLRPHDAGLFAPAEALGGLAGVAELRRETEAAGLRLLADLPLDGFPADRDGLALFDGEPMYEPFEADRAAAAPAGLRRFGYARYETANYLLCLALHWIEDLGFDGVVLPDLDRVLRYDCAGFAQTEARNDGGGNVDVAALEWVRALRELLAERAPQALVLAAEARSWRGVTVATGWGGLGCAAAGRAVWADLDRSVQDAGPGAAWRSLLALESPTALLDLAAWPRRKEAGLACALLWA